MVTAGANQAFTNLVCALLDASDAAVLFSPYYFNHLMALQVGFVTGFNPVGMTTSVSANAVAPTTSCPSWHCRLVPSEVVTLGSTSNFSYSALTASATSWRSVYVGAVAVPRARQPLQMDPCGRRQLLLLSSPLNGGGCSCSGRKRSAGAAPTWACISMVCTCHVQMTGGTDAVVFGRCNPSTWHPDLDWLEVALQGQSPPRMVVLINPCNPTGENAAPSSRVVFMRAS